MSTELNYLKSKEWSMGNGQCPDCCGNQPLPDNHIMGWWTDTVGHEDGCELAAAIRSAGGIAEPERPNTHPNKAKMEALDKRFMDEFKRRNPDVVFP